MYIAILYIRYSEHPD